VPERPDDKTVDRLRHSSHAIGDDDPNLSRNHCSTVRLLKRRGQFSAGGRGGPRQKRRHSGHLGKKKYSLLREHLSRWTDKSANATQISSGDPFGRECIRLDHASQKKVKERGDADRKTYSMVHL